MKTILFLLIIGLAQTCLAIDPTTDASLELLLSAESDPVNANIFNAAAAKLWSPYPPPEAIAKHMRNFLATERETDVVHMHVRLHYPGIFDSTLSIVDRNLYELILFHAVRFWAFSTAGLMYPERTELYEKSVRSMASILDSMIQMDLQFIQQSDLISKILHYNPARQMFSEHYPNFLVRVGVGSSDYLTNPRLLWALNHDVGGSPEIDQFMRSRPCATELFNFDRSQLN